MQKYLISALAFALPLFGAYAIRPVDESPTRKNAGKVKLQRSAHMPELKATTENDNSFFEGFEDRPDGYGTTYDEWLPEGWQDVSKSGHTAPGAGEYVHNLTWRVLNNENRQSSATVQNYAYEGEAFAYIMADVAYDGHEELETQDEWLITPTITPREEDWLYFKLFYRPSWTVANRHQNPNDYSYSYTFDGRNNELEVYASEDDGENWTKLWNVIDDEVSKLSEEELRADMLDVNKQKFDPIYVNIKAYAGKPIKIAFRYFGSHGHPMAIDNVAVGIPMPKASYTIPEGFLKQGMSAQVEYPVAPILLIPFEHETVWTNTSEDILSNEWSFADASGALTTSTDKDLTTPAYERLGRYPTPVLKGFFESRESDPFQVGFKEMQAGGTIQGIDTEGNEGEFGVGYYDITDPNATIAVSKDYIAYYPDVDNAWETVNGQNYGAYDVLGFANMYFKPEVPYGFDYVDVVANIYDQPVSENTTLVMSVYTLNNEGLVDALIAQTTLNGADIPYNEDNRYPVNLHFTFPTPVTISTDYILLLTGFSRDTDWIAFPYLRTTTEANMGNSLVYINAWDEYNGETDTFYNLNSFPFQSGQFGGLLWTLGASYSWMELVGGDTNIEVPAEGGSREFQVKAYHKPERWVLSHDGITVADWVSFTTTYDEASETYNVTLDFPENGYALPIDTDLYLMSPGSSLTFHVKQQSGIESTYADGNVKVAVNGGDIVVEGAAGSKADVYNVSGSLVAHAELSGNTVIAASHLPAGVYIVKIDGGKAWKVVK